MAYTAREAINQARARTIKDVTAQPLGNFLTGLSTEQTIAAVYIAAPNPRSLGELMAVSARTNLATGNLRQILTSSTTTNNASPAEEQAIGILLKDISGLPALRARVEGHALTRDQAVADYTTLIDDGYTALNDVVLQENDAPIVAQALDLSRMGHAQEYMAQENIIVSADTVSGKFTRADQREFTELVGARRNLEAQILGDMDPQFRAIYQRDLSPQATATLTALENKVIAAKPGNIPPVSMTAFQQVVGAEGLGLNKAGNEAGDVLAAEAAHSANGTYLLLGLSSGLGLLAVIVSIFVSGLIGRRLVRELRSLRRSALELADERLPDVVDQLALGMDVEVPPAIPEIPSSSDEIGQVRDAFARVQHTAVQAAVGQARLREGINEVFRNLARRSQSLLHRQLALLDAMERQASAPQELENLFRIDHLTTRMRRHAESLIVLSGRSPARGWRNPVPFVDVLRAAVAEVEDYTRIKVVSVADAALAGPAVGDVIHLIAELAENATVFSPPNTPVVMTGDLVGQGFAVEIEDRGLGLSEDKLEEINDRLANPPPFDPAGTDQLGLFVAGQLAKRHDIKVALRPSPFGGVTAIVLVPHGLVVSAGGIAELPPAPEREEVTAGHEHQAILARSGPAEHDQAATVMESTPTRRDRAPEPAGQGGPPGPSVPPWEDPNSPWAEPPPVPPPWAEQPSPVIRDVGHGRREPATAAPGMFAGGPAGTGAGSDGNSGARHKGPGSRSPFGEEPGGGLYTGRPNRNPFGSEPAHTPFGRPTSNPFQGDPFTPGTYGGAPQTPARAADAARPAAPAHARSNGPGPADTLLPAAGTVPSNGHVVDNGDGVEELPRRVRQASLAPQLRRETPLMPAPPSPPGSAPPRSPEQARAAMSAIQQGWERGRSVFEPTNPRMTRETGSGFAPQGGPSVSAGGAVPASNENTNDDTGV
ncbi:MAG TPA: nitrate- and nitrite sensing domain-containing protein [Streptosporangiaceae bacterium]|nr:nitrate- and nitrite sensing domain-containing protein [Streptosporangiaceae bacterium]